MRPDLRWHPRAITAVVAGRLRAMFRRDAVERELDEEIRFHLEMEIERNVRLGMNHADARRAALIAFGGIDRATEAHRDARGSRLAEEAIADARYAARALGRAPGFIAISVITLAVAVAIGTLGFTGANAFFYRPLPVPDGGNLLAIFTSDWSGRDKPGASSYADVVDFASDAKAIADIAGESRIMLTVAGNDDPGYVQGAIVTSKYFRVVGVRPAIGRLPSEGASSIVISHSLWRRAFAADSSVVGRTVRVNGQPFTVAAVAPSAFRGINRENGVDFWIDGALSPIVLLRDDLVQRRGNRSFHVVARLRDGQTLDALRARLSLSAARLYQAYPEPWRDTTGGGRVVTAMREQDAHLSTVPRAELLLLTAGVIAFGFGLVIIACTNLASMQMARAASRRREIATRLALGAGRSRLIRQLLAECSLVAFPGIVAGVVLALVLSSLLSYYRPIPLPSLDLALDWRAFAFIAGGLIVTLLVFGLVPALQSVRVDLLTDLKGGERAERRGLRIGGLRGGLIVAQIAMSVVFTASAGLVAFGLAHHANQGPDDAREILVSRVNFLPAGGDSARVEATLDRVIDGIRGIPGVRDVTAAYFIPVRGSRVSVYAETQSAGGEVKKRELDANYVRSGYLRFAGIRLLRGRDFDARTTRPVAIVSKAMADALWPGEEALGKHLKISDDGIAEVIGVAADPSGFIAATDHSYPGMLYLPFGARREAEVVLHVRAPTRQEPIATAIAQLLHRYDTQLVAPKPITLDEYYDRMLLPLRMLAQGSGALATLQFMLALAGLSGLVAYVTELRRHEIGIRTALGATRGSVIRLVMRQGIRLTAIGGTIGLLTSAAVAPLLGDVLPMTATVVVGGLLATTAVFAVIGTMAMLLPARRALGVTPAVALRVD